MFEFVNNRTLLAGEGALDAFAAALKKREKKKAFVVVYDSSAAYVRRLLDKLAETGIESVVCDSVSGEPNLAAVDQSAALCIQCRCDCVIACGGGSVIDVAKLAAMIAANGGECEDYQLKGRQVTEDPLFFAAIPTTAGTGAEATRVSVIYNEKKGYKKACYDNSLIAQLTVLDPDATAGIPSGIAAATGIDAVIHAVESYVSLNANALSRAYSKAAFELLIKNIEEVCKDTAGAQARGEMLLGSHLAGLALMAGSALAHIVGQPMGAVYHIPHGEACAMVFLASMRMNKQYAQQQYTDLASMMGIGTQGRSYDSIFEELLEKMESMMRRIGVPCAITERIQRDAFDLDAMVENICVSMGHIQCNPRPVNAEVYRQTLLLAME